MRKDTWQIRRLAKQELAAAASLAWRVFLQFEAYEYTEEGIEEFQAFIQDHEQWKKLLVYGAFEQQKLIGMLAMRENHISLLFVEKEYHRNGIAKALFHHMQSLEQHQSITVNSSPYAVDAYQHLGFQAIEKEQLLNGIRFTPMKLGS